MLSREDNERLVRTGPGTAAGEFFRRYWQPVLLSNELSDKDGAPVRVRILSEDLIAFRDTSGRIGLVDAYCPHRRAPLFFGRNEECGLRCVYHGWKFDADGNCIDLPSEPSSSGMKDRIKIRSYPTYEGGGVIWAYMGPAEHLPPVPDYEWMRAPQSHRHVSKTFEACNYLQALEGGLDTAHSSFLHTLNIANKNLLRIRDRAPRIDVHKRDYGYCYVSTRNAGADGSYVRVYQYLMPAQQMRGGITTARERNELPKLDGHIWVPIDDENIYVYNVMYSYDASLPLSDEFVAASETLSGRGKKDLIPGTFCLKRNRSNDYLIDRQFQKTTSYTGIEGINTQDFALQEGMGVPDRAKEHLGSSDKAIIAMRQLLLEAIKQVESGVAPRGLDPERYRAIRPFDGMVPEGAPWETSLASELRARW